jgi:hypothetical protein
MKKRLKKLTLSKETLRSLEPTRLGDIAGGRTNTACNTCQISFCICSGDTCDSCPLQGCTGDCTGTC